MWNKQDHPVHRSLRTLTQTVRFTDFLSESPFIFPTITHQLVGGSRCAHYASAKGRWNNEGCFFSGIMKKLKLNSTSFHISMWLETWTSFAYKKGTQTDSRRQELLPWCCGGDICKSSASRLCYFIDLTERKGVHVEDEAHWLLSMLRPKINFSLPQSARKLVMFCQRLK